jgi:hypothetical protein
MTALISTVPREHINNVWQSVAPGLEKAIERTHGRFHSVDILTSLLEGQASLWIAIRDKEIIGSLVFVITQYPSGLKSGRIDYIAGKDRDDWFEEMWNAVIAYAKETGCASVEMVARPGTAVYVEKWGGKRVGILMEYDLLKENSHG